MEHCNSEGRGVEPVSSTPPFVDVKISNEHIAACCSRELLATTSLLATKDL